MLQPFVDISGVNSK